MHCCTAQVRAGRFHDSCTARATGRQGASLRAFRAAQVRQFESLLHAPPALAAAPNINALAARMTVEELCRLGISTFAIAPGASCASLLAALLIMNVPGVLGALRCWNAVPPWIWALGL